ncbi:MAG: glutaredoxin family protein [Thermodesulforhabdaceae bacterium]|jgi:alkyl hydroperoxide reductase subunit F
MSARVRIFSTPTCPYCKQAKEFLSSKGIAFEDIDVTSNPEGLKEMRTITGGARTVPVIVIDDAVIVGYEEADVIRTLKEKKILTE